MQGSINFDGTLSGAISGGGGSGTDVVITPVITSGTKIADVSVNGEEKDLYCPVVTPTEVEVTQIQQSGTKIASIEVDGESVDLYAPTPSAPTEVSVTQVQQSGTKIATIGVNGVDTDIYAPESGGGGAVDYSTTEYDTGKKWIDGRTVYGRVVDFGSDVSIGNRSFVATSYVMSEVDIYLHAWGIRSLNNYCYSLDATNTFDAQKHLALSSAQIASVRWVILEYVKIVSG